MSKLSPGKFGIIPLYILLEVIVIRTGRPVRKSRHRKAVAFRPNTLQHIIVNSSPKQACSYIISGRPLNCLGSNVPWDDPHGTGYTG